MSKLLICPKRRGNTFAICDYVSKHADIDLRFTNDQDIIHLDDYETIILCSGVYGGKPHISIIKWIENLNKNQRSEKIKFYMLMTWFGRGKSDKDAMKKINLQLKNIDAKLEDNYVTCFGQGMGIIRRGHPDNKDFEKILNWINNL